MSIKSKVQMCMQPKMLWSCSRHLCISILETSCAARHLIATLCQRSRMNRFTAKGIPSMRRLAPPSFVHNPLYEEKTKTSYLAGTHSSYHFPCFPYPNQDSYK